MEFDYNKKYYMVIYDIESKEKSYKGISLGFTNKGRNYFCKLEDLPSYYHSTDVICEVSIQKDTEIQQYDSRSFRSFAPVYVERIIGRNTDIATLRILMDMGMDIDKYNGRILYSFAKENNLKMVRELLNIGADINAGDSLAICLAAENGNYEMVKYLHEQGSEIFSRDNYAIRNATRRMHFEISEYLYDHGADILAHDSHVRQRSGLKGIEINRFVDSLIKRDRKTIELSITKDEKDSASKSFNENTIDSNIEIDRLSLVQCIAEFNSR